MPSENRRVEFTQRVRAFHEAAFDQYDLILRRAEDAILAERDLAGPVRMALDMLMYQAVKSGQALSLLAEHALLEDAATVCRRLMELGVTATYIYADGDATTQAAHAARYLVHMWRQLPADAMDHIPNAAKTEWQALDSSVGDSLSPAARRWGPLWKDMFDEVGAEDLYSQDYSYLSARAHGSAEDLIVLFSHQTIKIHRHDHAWILLKFGSRYLMIALAMWNNIFQIVPDSEIESLRRAVVDWQDPVGPSAKPADESPPSP
jgi:hypothetical protein